MDALRCQHWCIKYFPYVLRAALSVLIFLLTNTMTCR